MAHLRSHSQEEAVPMGCSSQQQQIWYRAVVSNLDRQSSNRETATDNPLTPPDEVTSPKKGKKKVKGLPASVEQTKVSMILTQNTREQDFNNEVLNPIRVD